MLLVLRREEDEEGNRERRGLAGLPLRTPPLPSRTTGLARRTTRAQQALAHPVRELGEGVVAVRQRARLDMHGPDAEPSHRRRAERSGSGQPQPWEQEDASRVRW